MNFTAVTRLAGRTVLQAKQSSPRLMFVAGLVGVTTGAVMASKATLRLEDAVSKSVQQLNDISMVEADPNIEYSGRDAARDRAVVYGSIVFNLGKLYGPSLIVGGLGIACLTGSHSILSKRNAALTAAYAALERSYNAYRERVRNEMGEEFEQRFHHEVEKSIAPIGAASDPKSKKRGAYIRSPYSRWFNEETSPKQWNHTSRDKNLFFISCQERFANEKLHRRGYLFLNEVYESLGLEISEAGCVVGWVMDGDGDHYVDFGLFNHHTNDVHFYMGGINDEILLDFNVDGLVADKFGD